jgi:hypothetical protein
MWSNLGLGAHAVLYFGLMIWIVCGLGGWRDMHNEWMKKSASEKSRDRIWWAALLTFGMGAQGFIPNTWTMPLWLAILLTCVGGFGFLLVYILARGAKKADQDL